MLGTERCMPATIGQPTPSARGNVNLSKSPVVERTQFAPKYVCPDAIDVCDGSAGQFFVVAAHPELGIRTAAIRTAASRKPEFVEIRMRALHGAVASGG